MDEKSARLEGGKKRRKRRKDVEKGAPQKWCSTEGKKKTMIQQKERKLGKIVCKEGAHTGKSGEHAV